MNAIQSLFQSITSLGSTAENEDLVLGLPLESEGRTIYPVFRDPAPSGKDGTQPRQIGYLEVSEDRSDFTSLETDYRPVALLSLLVILLAVAIWMVRKSSGNRR